MAIYLKKFETISQYNAYTADTANFILPNVSLTVDNNTVYYNPYVPPETKVVAKFNVTESTMTQMIFGYRQTGPSSSAVTTAFTSVYVDGNEIEISDANVNYTFDTIGEHTVKYELKDPTTINSNVFNGTLNGLKGFNAVSITIPDSVTSIGGSAFQKCSSLTNITIPSGVTSIGSSAFAWCSSLTSITIPDNVTSIGDGFFQSCSSLTSCTIGSGVTSIGMYAFLSCSGLTNITIPNSVTSIGTRAFENCTNLTNITCNATTAPTIQSNTFQDVNSDGTLTVPIGSSGYDIWMGTGDYYLGKYNWTKVEQ